MEDFLHPVVTKIGYNSSIVKLVSPRDEVILPSDLRSPLLCRWEQTKYSTTWTKHWATKCQKIWGKNISHCLLKNTKMERGPRYVTDFTSEDPHKAPGLTAFLNECTFFPQVSSSSLPTFEIEPFTLWSEPHMKKNPLKIFRILFNIDSWMK